ncbi:MAG: hypothetical protein ABH883_07285 [Candidatus Omnitrophota bacterium]
MKWFKLLFSMIFSSRKLSGKVSSLMGLADKALPEATRKGKNKIALIKKV